MVEEGQDGWLSNGPKSLLRKTGQMWKPLGGENSFLDQKYLVGASGGAKFRAGALGGALTQLTGKMGVDIVRRSK